MNNKISKNKFQWVKFDISDCYEDFKSNDNHFSLTYSDYRKIIKTFLTIYFYEFFFLKYPIYFLFGGKIIKNKVTEKVRRQYSSKSKNNFNKLISTNNTVGIMWYDRPFEEFYDLQIKKLCGTTSSLIKIQKEWLKENDASALPTIDELLSKGYKFLRE